MDKRIYLSIMAALGTVAAVMMLALLVAPFAKSLLWALIIGVATMPHHDRLARLNPGNPNRTAGIMVLIMTLVFILPALFFAVIIAQNAADWYKQAEKFVVAFTQALPNTISSIPLGNEIIHWGDELGLDLTGHLATTASTISQFLLNAATKVALNLAQILFTLVTSLFILFYIYRDGDKLIAAGINRFAVNREEAFRYVREIRSTVTAITVGTILTCFAQGVLAGLGYFAAGIPVPALYGTLTAVAALIPVVGTAVVWLPLAAFLAISGFYLKACLLLLWCFLSVALADNAIRALAIGAKKDIPIPAVVLGAISGVVVMGLIGLIIGPLFFSILAVVWREATQSEHRENAPPIITGLPDDRPPTAIKAVLFDFGGVIAEEGFREGLFAIAHRQGLDPHEVYRLGADAVYDSGYVLGKGSEADFWALMRDRAGIIGDAVDLSAAVMPHFVLRTPMIEAVRQLRGQGFIVALLSDQTDWLEKLDRKYHFLQEFDNVFNSYHLGKGKRDPSVFADVTAALGINPAEALFIDDSSENIARAEEQGVRTIVFHDEGQFFGKLKQMLG